ncbi:tRNA pseudouridine(55) synthase TruB [Paenibacillus turpanensis]|uniref:tRNA pseudouridine(55) synthase TruB n=1 Tax=Paenibacillus turpanensis TaxID=2689078 RepID=UPI00140A3F6B|nr:tRNA pseudouridine(55) synthase TruB [Paenibacillus turpanensis]
MITAETIEGVLPIWKPAGMTSHDVVARVRRITRIKRIGHTGTLDPQVTGVLPLCIGRATRVVEYIQDLPKQYEAVVRIGQSTDTEDVTGELIEDRPGIKLSQDEIEHTLLSFVGTIEQVPPMYSAVKHDGKRLYELARQGIEVERKSRKVEIYGIHILKMQLEQEYPEVQFVVDCSKGTYIRTLCVDFGKKLGVPATMKQLVRSATGPFTEAESVPLEEVERLWAEGKLTEKLISADQALPHITQVKVNETLTRMALQGRALVSIDQPALQSLENGSIVRLYNEEQLFLGIFAWEASDRMLTPVKVFN